MADAEDFIQGKASATMTNRLRPNAISAAEELAQAVGRQGAIGILIGILISA